MTEPTGGNESLRSFGSAARAAAKRNRAALLASGFAGLFLTLWLFEVGNGPVEVGTLGEWLSGLATAGALSLSLAVIIHDRHQAQVRRSLDRMRKQMEPYYEDQRSSIEVPVVCAIEPVSDADVRSTERQYRLTAVIANHSADPITRLSARYSMRGDWTIEDSESWLATAETLREAHDHDALAELVALRPQDLLLLKADILGRGETARSDDTTALSAERVAAGSFEVSWFVGDRRYTDSTYGNGKQYRMSFPTRPD